jgi:hypothetical protein
LRSPTRAISCSRLKGRLRRPRHRP